MKKQSTVKRIMFCAPLSMLVLFVAFMFGKTVMAAEDGVITWNSCSAGLLDNNTVSYTVDDGNEFVLEGEIGGVEALYYSYSMLDDDYENDGTQINVSDTGSISITLNISNLDDNTPKVYFYSKLDDANWVTNELSFAFLEPDINTNGSVLIDESDAMTPISGKIINVKSATHVLISSTLYSGSEYSENDNNLTEIVLNTDNEYSFSTELSNDYARNYSVLYLYVVNNTSRKIYAKKTIQIGQMPSFTNDSSDVYIDEIYNFTGTVSVQYKISGTISNANIGYSLDDLGGLSTETEIIDLLKGKKAVNDANGTISVSGIDTLPWNGTPVYLYLFNPDTKQIYDIKTSRVKRHWLAIDGYGVNFICTDLVNGEEPIIYLEVGKDSLSTNYLLTNVSDLYRSGFRVVIRDLNGSIVKMSDPWYKENYSSNEYKNQVTISGLTNIPKEGKDYIASLEYIASGNKVIKMGKEIPFTIKNQEPEMEWSDENINSSKIIEFPRYGATYVSAIVSGYLDGDKIAWTTEEFETEADLIAWAQDENTKKYNIITYNNKVLFDIADFPRVDDTLHFYFIRQNSIDAPDHLGDYSVKYKTISHGFGTIRGYLGDIYKIGDIYVYFCDVEESEDGEIGNAAINGYLVNAMVGDQIVWTEEDLEGEELTTWASTENANVFNVNDNDKSIYGSESDYYYTYKLEMNNISFEEDTTSHLVHIYIRRDVGDTYQITYLGDITIKKAHKPELVSINSSEFDNENKLNITFEAKDFDTGIFRVVAKYKKHQKNYAGYEYESPEEKEWLNEEDNYYNPGGVVSGSIELKDLSDEEKRTITIVVEDKDGRETTYDELFVNKPEMVISPKNPLQSFGESNYYVSNSRNEDFIIRAYKNKDALNNGKTEMELANLKSITVKINGVEYPALGEEFAETEEVDNYPLTLNLSSALVPKALDNIYYVEVIAENKLGNKKNKEFKFEVDSNNPEITLFTVNDKQQYLPSSDEKNYKHIDNGEAKIKITAKDEGVGGLKDIKYYWQDLSGNKSNVVVDKIDERTYEATISLSKDQSFKGYLFANAEDTLGNKQEKDSTFGGIIIEKPETHNAENHINISVPESGAKDRSGNPLYNSGKTFTINVADGYSGIASVTWNVSAPHDSSINKSGSLTINENGDLTGSGWNKNGTDKNLVTAVSTQITVDGNSDDIELYVRMTDRAGNSSEQRVKFSIDKVNPTISVTYGGAAGDPEFTNYYADTRTATIVVKERNFNQDSANNMVSNTLGNKGTLSSWKESRDDKNPDNSTYTATVTFDKDDRYNLTYQVSDRAGNSADAVTTPEFIIDKINPEISIAFDNGNGLNGYFANARSATISVKDVNFEASRVTITGVNGQEYTISNWTRKDNTYSALITFSKDGVFSFEASVRDKAGNQGNTVRADKFTIDQTKPEITIEGLKDKAAYSGSIKPTISFKDTNIDKKSVKLELIGANRGIVDLTDKYIVSEDGLTYTLKDIEAIKENDDLYTLRVTVKDLAGNITTEEIKFSINRFGSIYVLGDLLKGINDKYVRNAKGLKVTEINVNKIKKGSVVITLSINGVPKTLVEGTDFTIVSKESDAEWNEYTYEFDDSLFGKDGSYIITISSEDEAGNKNNSDNEDKEASIKFGIDATAPIIAAINFEPYMFYAVNGMDFVISVKDNMLLDSFDIYVNGQKVDYSQDEEMITFFVAESNKRQDIKVVARDRAGNETIETFEGILVAGNILIRFAHNKAAIIITAASFLAILIGIGALIGIRRARL